MWGAYERLFRSTYEFFAFRGTRACISDIQGVNFHSTGHVFHTEGAWVLATHVPVSADLFFGCSLLTSNVVDREVEWADPPRGTMGGMTDAWVVHAGMVSRSGWSTVPTRAPPVVQLFSHIGLFFSVVC